MRCSIAPRLLLLPWWIGAASLTLYLRYGGSADLWRLGVGATIVSLLEVPVLAGMLRRYPEAGRPWFRSAWGVAGFLLSLPWLAWLAVQILAMAT